MKITNTHDNILVYSTFLFLIFNFINREIANFILLLILLLSFYPFPKINFVLDHSDFKFVYISSLFVFSIIIINYLSDDNISEIDNHSRYLILLPILLSLSKYRISSKHFFITVLASIYFSFCMYIYNNIFLNYDGRYLGSSSTSITFANLIITFNILILLEIIDRAHDESTDMAFYISRYVGIILSFYLWSETETRGSLIGYIFGLICIIIMYTRKSAKYVLLAIVFLVPIILSSGVYDRIKNTYTSIKSINISKMEDSIEFNTSENERIYYFKFAVDKMLKHPLSGIGSGSYETTMRSDLKSQGIAINARSHAHNDFLDIGSKFGLIPLSIFIIMLMYLFYSFVIHRSNLFARIGLVGLFSNIGFMLTQSQFAHHQATVIFIILMYISLSQIRRHSGTNSI
ncbi:MAG: O-antigen ligase family protein [Pseudomonadota bacterium]|nr:O-antigen ligase family protein [Pseudomonadota bacterium]